LLFSLEDLALKKWGSIDPLDPATPRPLLVTTLEPSVSVRSLVVWAWWWDMEVGEELRTW